MLKPYQDEYSNYHGYHEFCVCACYSHITTHNRVTLRRHRNTNVADDDGGGVGLLLYVVIVFSLTLTYYLICIYCEFSFN